MLRDEDAMILKAVYDAAKAVFATGEYWAVFKTFDPSFLNRLAMDIARAVLRTGRIGLKENSKPTVLQLELDTKTVNALIRNGLYYLEDLCQLTEQDLLDRASGIGHRSVQKIKEALAKLGLSLNTEEW